MITGEDIERIKKEQASGKKLVFDQQPMLYTRARGC